MLDDSVIWEKNEGASPTHCYYFMFWIIFQVSDFVNDGIT